MHVIHNLTLVNVCVCSIFISYENPERPLTVPNLLPQVDSSWGGGTDVVFKEEL